MQPGTNPTTGEVPSTTADCNSKPLDQPLSTFAALPSRPASLPAASDVISSDEHENLSPHVTDEHNAALMTAAMGLPSLSIGSSKHPPRMIISKTNPIWTTLLRVRSKRGGEKDEEQERQRSPLREKISLLLLKVKVNNFDLEKLAGAFKFFIHQAKFPVKIMLTFLQICKIAISGSGSRVGRYLLYHCCTHPSFHRSLSPSC
jgi:hypothetical protein